MPSNEPRNIQGFSILRTLAYLVVVIAGLQAAATVILPILVAALFAMVFLRPMRFLVGRGIPRWIAVPLIVAAAALVPILVTVAVETSIDEFDAKIPFYTGRLETMVADVFDAVGERVAKKGPTRVADAPDRPGEPGEGRGPEGRADGAGGEPPSTKTRAGPAPPGGAQPPGGAPEPAPEASAEKAQPEVPDVREDAPAARQDAAAAAAAQSPEAKSPTRGTPPAASSRSRRAASALAVTSLRDKLWETLDPSTFLGLVKNTVGGVLGLLSDLFVILLVMLFMLLEAGRFSNKLQLAFGRDLGRFGQVGDKVFDYLFLKAVVSLLTGLCVAGFSASIGLDFPMLWGLVAFLFNFIPTIGSIIAAIPAVLLGLVQEGVSLAMVAAAGYLAINIVIGNLLEPRMMGRRFGLSALVVLVSMLFWAWVWGPIGMLLSIPLTMVVKIVLEHTDDYRFVAVLLGPAPARPRREERVT